MTDEDKKTICFQIEKKDYQRLKDYAKTEQKTTVSWMLRNLVANFIEKIEK